MIIYIKVLDNLDNKARLAHYPSTYKIPWEKPTKIHEVFELQIELILIFLRWLVRNIIFKIKFKQYKL